MREREREREKDKKSSKIVRKVFWKSNKWVPLYILGCPTDYSLMGVLQEFNGTGQVLHADFDAFKFPTSSVVQFRALVMFFLPAT